MKKMIIIAFIVLIGSCTIYSQSHAIIVNKDNTTTALSNSVVKNIFTGNRQSWDDGSKIVVCFLNVEANQVSQEFFKNVLDLSLGDFNKLWLKKVLTGNAAKPNQFNSENELINYISNNKGAVGFISSANKGNIGSCKVIN